jgi:hypothetical protein
MKGKRGICAVCHHPKRREMEVGLVCMVPLSALASRFDVSTWSLHRHRHRHLSAVQKAALLAAMKPSGIDLEALQRSESESLLAQLLAQRATLQQYSAAAFEGGNIPAAVSAERGVCDNLALVSKLLGMITQHHTVTHQSILISGDYIELRSAITQALKPFPEAARAVSAALAALEAKASDAIRQRAAEGKRPLTIEHEPSGTVQ